MLRGLLSVAAISAAIGCGKKAPTPAPKAAPDSVAVGEPAAAGQEGPQAEEVSELVTEMNSDKYGAPPVTFRPGHVTPMTAPAAKSTASGFEIQFPAHAPITTPAVYRGKVFVSGGFNSKELHSFVAATGKSAWSVGLDDDGPSSIACDDGVCVFNTESCTIFALDAESGKMLWSHWLGDPLTSAPTIAGGRVYTSYPASGTADGKPKPPNASHALAAFDLKSGQILWQKWIDSDVMSAPVASKDFVYVTTFGGTIAKLEQKTGTFRYAMLAKATSAPVIQFSDSGLESLYYTRRGDNEQAGAEEMIIRADHNSPKTKYKAKAKKAKYIDESVQAESKHAAEGAEDDAQNGFSSTPSAANAGAASQNVGSRSVSTMQAFQGSRILHLGSINVNTMGDEIVATSAETGDELWTKKLEGDVAASGGFLGTAPLAAGDSVIVATLGGDVLRIDPKNGKVRQTYAISAQVRSQPVVVDGWIYVGTTDGRLVAINTKDKKLTGWTTWGGNAARSGALIAK